MNFIQIILEPKPAYNVSCEGTFTQTIVQYTVDFFTPRHTPCALDVAWRDPKKML